MPSHVAGFVSWQGHRGNRSQAARFGRITSECPPRRGAASSVFPILRQILAWTLANQDRRYAGTQRRDVQLKRNLAEELEQASRALDRGLAQALQRAASRVAGAYAALQGERRRQPPVYADATSGWVGRPGWWLGVFTSPERTSYRVVEPTNNRAERGRRPAGIARKWSCGNKTEAGRACGQVRASRAAICRQRAEEFIDCLAVRLPLAATTG